MRIFVAAVFDVDFWGEYLYILLVLFMYRGNSSVVEHCLAKARVAGSNPVSRSMFNGVSHQNTVPIAR